MSIGSGFALGGITDCIGENTSGFDDDINADFAPRNVGGIFFVEDFDVFTVDDEIAAGNIDCTLESAIGRVIFEQMGVCLCVKKVID